MRTFVVSAALCAFLIPSASGASLRFRGKPQLGARRCKPYKSLLQAENILVPDGPAGSGLGARGPAIADGYSRVACENDIAPPSQRISFKEHACGPNITTCRLTELGMTPRLCFDFCRQYENAKFFGLKAGRDCYCSVYYHAHTTGGGDCNAVCEGDKKEMCGGMEKSSMFEMHMCQDSASEADHAAGMSKKAVGASKNAVSLFKTYIDTLQGLANTWTLGVCAVKPEGERVCQLSMDWTKMGNDMSTLSSESDHLASVLQNKTNYLTAAQAKLPKDGEGATSEQLAAVELSTKEVTEAAAKVTASVEVMNLKMKAVNLPEATQIASLDIYSTLGDTKNNWYAVCALVPVPGASYAFQAKGWNDDTAKACASRCIGLSTGLNACAAFNYQAYEGLVTCQMLTAQGIVERDDSITSAVPIFEVSQTKRNAMSIAEMGCMAHHRFTAGHPKGPLGTKVIREVTV